MAKKIVIGCDPEFGLLRKKVMIIAEDIIRDGANKNTFGVDGNGSPAELRPAPSKDPLKVVFNIRKAMIKGIKKYPRLASLEWKAGSIIGSEPIGGHIHFSGLPFRFDEEHLDLLLEEGYDFEDMSSSEKRKFKYISLFVKALDTYLGQIVVIIEHPKEARKRRRDYGNLGDCRKSCQGVLEYRVLSSWLTSPAVAAGILCLAKTVAHEAAFNDLGKYIRKDIVPNAALFNHASYVYHKKKFKRLWHRIRKMELYPKYKKYINFLRRLISAKKNWYPTYDMKEAWKIPTEKSSTPCLVDGEDIMVKINNHWEERSVEEVDLRYFVVGSNEYKFADYKKTWKLK